MPIKSVRIELNRAGIGELLNRHETEQMLLDKMENVGDVARQHAPMVGGGIDDTAAEALPITVSSSSVGKRAHARVVADHWAGLAVEAKHRLLVSSLDAAR